MGLSGGRRRAARLRAGWPPPPQPGRDRILRPRFPGPLAARARDAEADEDAAVGGLSGGTAVSEPLPVSQGPGGGREGTAGSGRPARRPGSPRAWARLPADPRPLPAGAAAVEPGRGGEVGPGGEAAGGRP